MVDYSLAFKQPVIQIGSDGVTPTPSGSKGDPGYVADAPLAGQGDYQVSISTSVDLPTAIGGAIPAGATSVYIQPIGGDIFMSRDAVAASATHGLKIFDGTAFPVTGGLSSVRLFAAAATTVNLQFRG